MVVVIAIACGCCAGQANALVVPSLQAKIFDGFSAGAGDVWAAYDVPGVSEEGLVRVSASGGVTKLPTPILGPSAVGSDGDLWVADIVTNRVARVTPSGQVAEFGATPAPATFSNLPPADSVTPGPDGDVWFAGGQSVTAVASDGTAMSFAFPLGSLVGATATTPAVFDAIAAGRDGTLWATATGAHGGAALQISSLGQLIRAVQFPFPGNPVDVAVASGGDVWVTASGALFDIDPATGQYRTILVRAAEVPPGDESEYPTQITAGPDGNIWFSDRAELGRVTPAGQLSLIRLPRQIPQDSDIGGLVTNAGRLWLTLDQTSSRLGPLEGGGVATYTPPRYACTVPRVHNTPFAAAMRRIRRAGCQPGPTVFKERRCPAARLRVSAHGLPAGSRQLGLTDIPVSVTCAPKADESARPQRRAS